MRPRSIIRFIATFFAIINPAGYIGNGRFEKRNDVSFGEGGLESAGISSIAMPYVQEDQLVSGLSQFQKVSADEYLKDPKKFEGTAGNPVIVFDSGLHKKENNLQNDCNDFDAKGDPSGRITILGEFHDRRLSTSKCIDALSAAGVRHEIYIEGGPKGKEIQCSLTGFKDVRGRKCIGLAGGEERLNKFSAKYPEFNLLRDFHTLYSVYDYSDHKIEESIKKELSAIKDDIKTINNVLSEFDRIDIKKVIKAIRKTYQLFDEIGNTNSGKSVSDREKFEAIRSYLIRKKRFCEELLDIRKKRNISYSEIIPELLKSIYKDDKTLKKYVEVEKFEEINRVIIGLLNSKNETSVMTFFALGRAHLDNEEVRKTIDNVSDFEGKKPRTLRMRLPGE